MRRLAIIHPFLFAIFPILFLFSHNITLWPFSVTRLPLIIVLSVTSFLLLITWSITRNLKKSSIFVSWFIILFFSYGYIFEVIEGWHIGKLTIGNNVNLIISWIIFFIAGSYLIFSTRSNLDNYNLIMNIVSISLIGISVFNIGIYKLQTKTIQKEGLDLQFGSDSIRAASQTGKLPNIYYIVMDGYARADILKENYNYDNAEFINNLTQMGFYVADSSRSNYIQTIECISSTLNLEYLDRIAGETGIEYKDRDPLLKMIKENRLFKLFKSYGYNTVSISTEFSVIDKNDADVIINPGISLDLFSNALIGTTPLGGGLLTATEYDPYKLRRKNILNALSRLGNLSDVETPFILYVHIMAPHPPFVFDEQGNEIQPDRKLDYGDGTHYLHRGGTVDEYVKNYPPQTAYINKKLKETLENILANSAEPPVIVVQGDHGSRLNVHWESLEQTNLKESFSIFNAYYLPYGGDDRLYESITPVNTFRLIADFYLGTGYGLLKDTNYYSKWSTPYDFTDVTDQIDIKNEPKTVLQETAPIKKVTARKQVLVCDYFPADANMSAGQWPPRVIGSDVTYLVSYFRKAQPPCKLDGFYCSGDVNGDCQVIGSDITRIVSYFRKTGDIKYCADYPPAWLTPDDLPDDAPAGWPNCEKENQHIEN